MPVTVVAETEHEPTLRLVPTAEDQVRPERVEFPTPPPARPIFPAREIMAIIEVLLKVLSLRMLLAAAFGAMAWLGYLTVSDPSVGKIVGMAVWAILGFIPLVLLVRAKG